MTENTRDPNRSLVASDKLRVDKNAATSNRSFNNSKKIKPTKKVGNVVKNSESSFFLFRIKNFIICFWVLVRSRAGEKSQYQYSQKHKIPIHASASTPD